MPPTRADLMEGAVTQTPHPGRQPFPREERLRREFDQPLRIESLAREVGMSVSGFHHQFKAVTAMSPLQFQKQLRLQEARRLLLGEHLDAASAGLRVGYDDASQFSREYKRLFGQPPMRDGERLRAAARREAPSLEQVVGGRRASLPRRANCRA